MNTSTSLVTAAFNEAATLPKLIELSKPYVDEIIVVDDGSTDGTEEILANFDIVYIKNSTNLGQEKSFEEGIKQAKGEIIVTIDSDLEHDPHDIPLLVEHLTKNSFDIVVGAREELPRMSEQKVAEFTSKKYNLLDPFCNFRAFYKYVYTKLGFFYKHDYYGVDFNISGAQHFRLDSIPIHDMPRRTDARIGSMDAVDKKLLMVFDYLQLHY